MKFKIPPEIGVECWFDLGRNPCCTTAHIATQLGYDASLDNLMSVPDFLSEKLGVSPVEITMVQTRNDKAGSLEQRRQVFREFLESLGHEVEE